MNPFEEDNALGKAYQLTHSLIAFGRGELFPHSDVDVLVLRPDEAQADASTGSDSGAAPDWQARIERFIGSCWDSGLDIGSSVRTVSVFASPGTPSRST